MTTMDLTDVESDCLKEMVNVGGGHAVGVVSTMLNKKVALHVPYINPESSFSPDSDDELLLLHAPVESEQFQGKLIMKMRPDAAVRLRNMLTKQEHTVVDPAHEAELRKLGTSVISAYGEALSNFLHLTVDGRECTLEQASRASYISNVWGDKDSTILVSVSFSVDDEGIAGDFELSLSPQDARNVLERIKQQFGLV